jgi:hypothetical protein
METEKPLPPLYLSMFEATERGNILLAHNEEPWINAWIRLQGELHLSISYRNCNYPALHVSTVTVTDSELADHINREFGGGLWTARKMSINGVYIGEDNIVIGNEETDDDMG